MKYLLRVLLSFISVITLIFINNNLTIAEEIIKEEEQAKKEMISINAGLCYSSIYWWRGTVISDGAPAFFPTVELGYGDFTLTFMVGISEDLFTAEETTTKKAAKSYTELDYTAGYGLELDMFSIEAGLTYVQYPFYDEADEDETDPSFLEINASLTANTFLSPSLSFYYDYYVDARTGEDGKEVPVNKDYYIKFSISHDIISTEDGFTLSAGAWAGYYNDPYFEMQGLSDAAATIGFSKEHKELTFASNFFYGRTIGKDFKDYNSGKKNYFWCDFGITYAI